MFQTKDVDLISSFRRVQNIVCFLLGNSPASDLFMEQIECSETSAYINQTPWNYPKENKLYSEHGESLKSRILLYSLKVSIL